jgi:hypothetical protein
LPHIADKRTVLAGESIDFIQIQGSKIEVLVGDITEQDVDVIINCIDDDEITLGSGYIPYSDSLSKLFMHTE